MCSESLFLRLVNLLIHDLEKGTLELKNKILSGEITESEANVITLRAKTELASSKISLLLA